MRARDGPASELKILAQSDVDVRVGQLGPSVYTSQIGWLV